MATSIEKLREQAFKCFEGGDRQVAAELEKAAAMIEAASWIATAIERLATAVRYHAEH